MDNVVRKQEVIPRSPIKLLDASKKVVLGQIPLTCLGGFRISWEAGFNREREAVVSI